MGIQGENKLPCAQHSKTKLLEPSGIPRGKSHAVNSVLSQGEPYQALNPHPSSWDSADPSEDSLALPQHSLDTTEGILI